MDSNRFEVYKYFCGIRESVIIPEYNASILVCYKVLCSKCKYDNEGCNAHGIAETSETIQEFNSQLIQTNPEYFI